MGHRCQPTHETVQTAINRLMEETFRPYTATTQEIAPALDLYETAEYFHVELSLPGLKIEDIDITHKENVLTIKGESKPSEGEERRYHHQERRYGAFTRKVSFSNRVHFEGITATYNNGVLSIRIPKVEEPQPRKVDIQAS